MSDKTRDERLKAALRENLRKRKAQARQRSAGSGYSTADEHGGEARTPGGKSEGEATD